MYRSIIRPFLFSFPPETMHEVSVHLASSLQPHDWLVKPIGNWLRPDTDPVTLWNLKFPNRIGLAAGYDKNGMAPWIWWMLGFGHAELGGVTRYPQPGNPQPRVFRLPADHAIINRMGFNNEGADSVAHRLESMLRREGKPPIPLGMNLGKNKWVPNNEAPDAYRYVLARFYDLCDFFVVNVSSPNTPNLRQLQELDSLRPIFDELWSFRASQSIKKPILLKVAPDLNDWQVGSICQWVVGDQVDGLVVSNTTLSREGLRSSSRLVSQTGGLSGAPVRERSTTLIRQFASQIGSVPIIGSGGIFSVEDAAEKLEAGASLVQVYTGMIYEGPQLIGRLVRGTDQKNKLQST